MTITLSRKQLIEIVILVIGIIALVLVVMPRQKGSDVWLPPGVTREDFERSLKSDREQKEKNKRVWEELEREWAEERAKTGHVGKAF